MSEEKQRVSLGGQSFVIKRVPMARIKLIKTALTNIFKDFGNAELSDGDIFGALIDRVLELPHEVLSLFIEDLPVEIFLDEKDGVSFPEFIEALELAITINKLDKLKAFFSKMAPALAQTMVTIQPKAN